jgi:hypothetical protein
MSMPAMLLSKVGRSDTGRAKIQRPRLGLGERDQLADILRLHRRIDDQHDRHRGNHRHRSKGFSGIEWQLLVEGAVDGQRRRRGQQQGVAIGLRARDRLGADIAAGPATVLDQEILAVPLGQLLRDDTGDDVVGAAGRERHDDLDGPGGIILRTCNAGEQNGRTSGQKGASHNPAHGHFLDVCLVVD